MPLPKSLSESSLGPMLLKISYATRVKWFACLQFSSSFSAGLLKSGLSDGSIPFSKTSLDWVSSSEQKKEDASGPLEPRQTISPWWHKNSLATSGLRLVQLKLLFTFQTFVQEGSFLQRKKTKKTLLFQKRRKDARKILQTNQFHQ